eukprot:scaffold547_cov87-Skeletonema_dohrnii-CCMP3373.AAC.3
MHEMLLWACSPTKPHDKGAVSDLYNFLTEDGHFSRNRRNVPLPLPTTTVGEVLPLASATRYQLAVLVHTFTMMGVDAACDHFMQRVPG